MDGGEVLVPFQNQFASNSGTMIKSTLQSVNFAVAPEGTVTGWQLARNGTCTFTNVAIGNVAWGVDLAGNASFASLSVDAADISVGGVNLIADVVDALPQGVIGLASRATPGPSVTVAEPYLELQVTLFEGRAYEIRIHPHYMTMSANTKAVEYLYYTSNGSAVTTASTAARSTRTVCGSVGTAVTVTGMTFHVNNPPGTGTLNYRFLLGYVGETTAANITAAAGYPVVMTVEDKGVYVVDTGIDRVGGDSGSGTKTTYTKTYYATWSGSYYGDNSRRSVNGYSYQGQYSGYPANGNQRSMFGFNYAAIQADLSGATVHWVKAYTYFTHWAASSGGTAVFGSHNSSASSAPSTWTGTANRATKVYTARNQGQVVTMPVAFGNELKAGTAKGLVLGPANSTTDAQYGYANGYTLANPPYIQINYTK